MLYWTTVVLGTILLLMAGATVAVLLTRRGNSAANKECKPDETAQAKAAAPKKFGWLEGLGCTFAVILGLVALSWALTAGSFVFHYVVDDPNPKAATATATPSRQLTKVEQAIEKVKAECEKIDKIVKAPAGKDDKGEYLWSEPVSLYDAEASPPYLYSENHQTAPIMFRLEDGSVYDGGVLASTPSKTVEYRAVGDLPTDVPVSIWRCKAK